MWQTGEGIGSTEGREQKAEQVSEQDQGGIQEGHEVNFVEHLQKKVFPSWLNRRDWGLLLNPPEAAVASRTLVHRAVAKHSIGAELG